MGRHSPQKREYDNLAKECFESRGYEVEFVGGRLADLVAWRPSTREFSIVEVKSPRERDADIHFESEESYVDVKGVRRQEVWSLIQAQDFAVESPGMARLIAFTVTSQLYTYWLKAGEHLKRFQANRGKEVSPGQNEAFLVLPMELQQFTIRLLQVLQQAGLIRAFNTTGFGKLGTVEIQYSDLA